MLSKTSNELTCKKGTFETHSLTNEQMIENLVEPLTFLQNGGEMGKRIRSIDWSNTEVGAPETWPLNLRTAISLLLNSRFPMFIWWGKN